MLDDPSRVASMDGRGMLASVEALPEHLAEGVRLGRASGAPKAGGGGIVVCGVGGSAIGGDMLRAWLSTVSDARVEVVRGYALPRGLSRDALVVVSSYSGNTEETLSMLEDARSRASKLVTVSSGGSLAQASESQSIPHVRVPAGMVPRASFGYMFGALLGIADRAGVASPGGQVDEACRALRALNDESAVGIRTQDNAAKRMAHELHGTVPVVIGHGISAPVAKRWANQMNENAKCVAFSSELPEMDHNEIVSWVSDPRSQGFSAVFLDHGHSDGRMARRLEVTRELVCRRARAHMVKAVGEAPLAQMMSLVALGDYVSVYSAVLRGEDPSTTAPIEELKRILSEK